MQTFGWDLVSARGVDSVNAALAGSLDETPVVVAYEDTAASLSIDATFGPWKIVPGGSNKLLHFEMPVKTGTLKNQGTPFDLAGVVAVIELQLVFIDNVSTANVKDLRFNLKVPGKQVGDTTEGAVSLVKTNAPETLVKPAQQAFGDNLVQCLLANRDKLAYVFASINTDSAGSAKWMAPKRSNYCYAQGANGQPGYLAILSVLTDRDTTKLQLNVDPPLLDGKSELISALSGAMFIEHVITPSLPKPYSPLKTINVDTIVGNMPLTPIVFTSNASVENDKVRIDMEIVTDLGKSGLGSYGSLTSKVTMRLPLRFDAKTKAISLVQDPNPEVVTNRNTESTAQQLLDLLKGDLLSQFSKAIAAVFRELIGQQLASANIVQAINVPDLTASAVVWNTSSIFEVVDAGLADALYFRQSEKYIPEEPPMSSNPTHGINPHTG